MYTLFTLSLMKNVVCVGEMSNPGHLCVAILLKTVEAMYLQLVFHTVRMFYMSIQIFTVGS